jgi:hypothetical protein
MPKVAPQAVDKSPDPGLLSEFKYASTVYLPGVGHAMAAQG